MQSGQGHSLASLGEVAIIFGGVNENNDGCKGTYSYDPFTGNGWKNAVAPGRIQPKDRAFAAMTSFGPDQTSNPKLVLFGGYSPYTKEPLDDTWIFSMLDGWKNIQVNKGPSGRAYHGMVTNYLYAQGPRVAILFGGTGSTQSNLVIEECSSETWSFYESAESTYNWTHMLPHSKQSFNPPGNCRFSFSSIFNTPGSFVLFGGMCEFSSWSWLVNNDIISLFFLNFIPPFLSPFFPLFFFKPFYQV